VHCNIFFHPQIVARPLKKGGNTEFLYRGYEKRFPEEGLSSRLQAAQNTLFNRRLIV